MNEYSRYLGTLGLMHVAKVSSLIGQCGLHRLKREDT